MGTTRAVEQTRAFFGRFLSSSCSRVRGPGQGVVSLVVLVVEAQILPSSPVSPPSREPRQVESDVLSGVHLGVQIDSVGGR